MITSTKKNATIQYDDSNDGATFYYMYLTINLLDKKSTRILTNNDDVDRKVVCITCLRKRDFSAPDEAVCDEFSAIEKKKMYIYVKCISNGNS